MRSSAKLPSVAPDPDEDAYGGPTKVGPMSEEIARKMQAELVAEVKRSGVRHAPLPTASTASTHRPDTQPPRSGVREPELPRAYDDEDDSHLDPTLLAPRAQPPHPERTAAPIAPDTPKVDVVDAVIGEMMASSLESAREPWAAPTAPFSEGPLGDARGDRSARPETVPPVSSVNRIAAPARDALVDPFTLPPSAGSMAPPPSWSLVGGPRPVSQVVEGPNDRKLFVQVALGLGAFLVFTVVLVHYLF